MTNKPSDEELINDMERKMEEADLLDFPTAVVIEGEPCLGRDLVGHMRGRTAHGVHMLGHLRSNTEFPDPEFIVYVEKTLDEKGRLDLGNITINGIARTPREMLQEVKEGTAFGADLLAHFRTMHANGEL